MLYDVMNNVLGNILTMSDEFHRAVYFLTTLKLGHWHHNEVCFTKRQHPATYQVEEVLIWKREEWKWEIDLPSQRGEKLLNDRWKGH